MEQLNGLDSLMALAETSQAPLHIGALFIYAPSGRPPTAMVFEDVVAQLNEAIADSLPMLKSRLLKVPLNIDSPYWVADEDFNIDFHVQRVALPQPANWDALYTLAGQFHAQPLNMERPLWQAQFIEGLDHVKGIPKGAVGLLLKIHHALADGKTAVKIFSALHSLSPKKNAKRIYQESEEIGEVFSNPGMLRMYSRAYWHGITAPLKFMATVTRLAPKLILSSVITRDSFVGIPKTDFNGTPTSQRFISHIKMPITDLKALERVSACTINDMALCVISGALREYLKARDALPEQSLHSVIPVDIRTDKSLASVGNQLSFINLNLASDLDDVKQRLAFIHSAAVEAKEETINIGKQSIMSLANNVYSGATAWAVRKLIKSKYSSSIPLLTNTIVTNVPGVPVPCYLCGKKLVDYIGFGPLIPTVSLFHVVSSVDSHVNISFQACGEPVLNMDEYQRALARSYKQLLSAFDM